VEKGDKYGIPLVRVKIMGKKRLKRWCKAQI